MKPLRQEQAAPAAAHRRLRETAAWRVAYAGEPALRELLEALVGRPRAADLAGRLIARFGDVHGLARATPDELLQVHGVGLHTAARLKAALALARRLLEPGEEQPCIRSPADAARLLMPRLSALEQEHLVVLLLNTRHRLIGPPVEVYRGSLNTSLIRTGEVFRQAVKANAAAIIVAHNHPSSDPSPSQDDLAVTRALVEAGRLLDIELVDHIIIGGPGWVSLKERGLGFAPGGRA